eukprot:14741434-Heterocapsa_arctica.AAC.1
MSIGHCKLRGSSLNPGTQYLLQGFQFNTRDGVLHQGCQVLGLCAGPVADVDGYLQGRMQCFQIG